MQQLRKISIWCIGLVSAALLLSSGKSTVQPALAATDILLSALSKLETPQTGQVVHYVSELYNRLPPATLEPSDPYHLPYKDFWFTKTVEHQWLEIGDKGKVSRWRTQLFNENGQILQDLFFDGVNETVYFSLEKNTMRFPAESPTFEPYRKGFIEYYLKQEKLNLRSFVLEGHSVNSIYGESEPFQRTFDVESDLLSLSTPFIADVKPQSVVKQIDFDSATNLPVREATVVVDSLGTEYIVAYRTMSDPQVLSRSEYNPDVLFHQEIPESVLTPESFTPIKSLTTLEQINQFVNYPLYVYQSNNNAQLELIGSDLALPESNSSNSQFPKTIELASSLGMGTQTIYSVKQNESARVVVIQGPKNDLKEILQQTKPAWTLAAQKTIQWGGQAVVAWELTTPNADTITHVIENDNTLVFIKSSGVPLAQLQEGLSNFSILAKSDAVKIFIPFASH